MNSQDRSIRKLNLDIQKKIWERAEKLNLPYKDSAKKMYLNLLEQVKEDETHDTGKDKRDRGPFKIIKP